MKRILVFLLLLISDALPVHGQATRTFVAATTVSGLPAPALSVGMPWYVKDGTSASDCTVGGGNFVSLCVSNGTAWIASAGNGVNPGGVSGDVQTNNGAGGLAGGTQLNNLFNKTTGGTVVGDTQFTGGLPEYDIVCVYNEAADTAAFWGTLAAYEAAQNVKGHIVVRNAAGNLFGCKLDTSGHSITSAFNNSVIEFRTDVLTQDGPIVLDGTSSVTLIGGFDSKFGAGGNPTSFQPDGAMATISARGDFPALEMKNGLSGNLVTHMHMECDLISTIDEAHSCVYVHGMGSKNTFRSVVAGEAHGHGMAIDMTDSFSQILDSVTINGSEPLFIRGTTIELQGDIWLQCSSTLGDSPYAIGLDGAGGVPELLQNGGNITIENLGAGHANLAWNNGTTYSKWAGVGSNANAVTFMGGNWVSLQNGNTNHSPPSTLHTSNAYWAPSWGAYVDVGPQNWGVLILNSIGDSDASADEVFKLHTQTGVALYVASINFQGQMGGQEFDTYHLIVPYDGAQDVQTLSLQSAMDVDMYQLIPFTGRTGNFPYYSPVEMSRIGDLWRNGVPVTVSHINQVGAGYTSAGWSGASGCITFTTGQTDYLGGALATKASCNSGTGTWTIHTFSGVYTAGTIFMFTVAVKGTTADPIAPISISNITSPNNWTVLGYEALDRNGVIVNSTQTIPINTGWRVYKILAEATNSLTDPSLVANTINGNDTYFSFPTAQIYTPGEIPDPEGMRRAFESVPYSPDCIVGNLCTPRGKIEDTSYVELQCFAFTADITVGDGCWYYTVPANLNGKSIVSVSATVKNVGTTMAGEKTTIQIAKCSLVATGNQCTGTVVDTLTTPINIDSNQNKSSTAGTQPVINAANAVLATDQILREDVDTVTLTAAPKGLTIIIGVK